MRLVPPCILLLLRCIDCSAITIIDEDLVVHRKSENSGNSLASGGNDRWVFREPYVVERHSPKARAEITLTPLLELHVVSVPPDTPVTVDVSPKEGPGHTVHGDNETQWRR